MTTIAASSSPVSYAPVTAPAAVSRPSDAARPGGEGVSDGIGAFGPAVILDLPPPENKALTLDERVKSLTERHAEKLRQRGWSEEEVTASVINVDTNIRAGHAAMEASQKFESQRRPLQANLEQILSDSGGPQSLIDAVRDVTRMAGAVGGSGAFEATYAKQETRDQIRQLEGDDALQRSISTGKIYDSNSRANAFSTASALSRYGIDGPAFKVTDTGKLALNSFTLKNVGGGYALAFDAKTWEFNVFKEGVDITAAIFAGKAFS